MIADVHLDTFPRRTPTKDFRLKQSHLIIENIIKAAKKEGALDFIYIAGDLVEKPNRDAITHQVVKECMRRLSQEFKEVRYILGNHDMVTHSVGSESSEYDAELSYLPLYVPENFIYSDKQVIEREGFRLGFRNYSTSATLDLSFLNDEPVDFLIGHSSQIYEGDEENCPYAAQDYDRNLVRELSFWGHIHKAKENNTDVSIGVPHKCHTTDNEPGAVILELNEGKYQWWRVDVDPEQTQMDVVSDDVAECDYYDEITNTYHVARKAKTFLKVNVNEKLRELGSSELILKKYVEANNLERCFRLIKENTPLDDVKKLNLFFTTTSLRIHNWRSISDAEFNFEEGGKYYVAGANGSGKSSFLTALKFAISGETSTGEIKSFIKRGQKEMWVEVELNYEGKHYLIHRGTDSLYVEENGIRLELGDKNTSKKKIKELLPFSTAMDLMFFGKDNPSVLRGADGSGNTAKIEIFARLLGLTEIEAYYKTALEKKKDIEPDLKYSDKAFEDKYGNLEAQQEFLKQLREKLGNPVNITDEILFLRSQYDYYKNLLQQYQEEQILIASVKEEMSKLDSNKKLLQQYQEDLKEYEENSWYESEKQVLRENYKQLKIQAEQLQENLNQKMKLELELRTLWDERNQIANELGNLKMDDAPVCSTYGVKCPIITVELREKAYNEKKLKLQLDYTTKDNTYNQKLQEYNTIPDPKDKYNSLTNEMGQISAVISGLEIKEKQKINLDYKIVNLKQLISQQEENMRKKGIPDQLTALPDNAIEIMDLNMNKITELGNLEKQTETFNLMLEQKNKDYDKLLELKLQYQDLVKFLEITKTSGPVYEEILGNVMKGFSTQNYIYTIDAKSAGRGRSMAITAKHINSDGTEIYYASGSGGETSMMDIHFLTALSGFTGFGLLVLDELLGYVDATNHDLATEMIKNLDGIGQLFFISHKDNQTPIFDNIIECEKSKLGDTNYIL